MPLVDISQIEGRKKFRDFQSKTNISLQNRYVYVALDKVANSTVKDRLYRIEYEPVGWKAVTLFDKKCSPLLSPYQLPWDQVRDVLNGGNYTRFAFVRNPYTRLLSCYLDRIMRARSTPRRRLMKQMGRSMGSSAPTFEEFVRTVTQQASVTQDSHWRDQSDELLIGTFDYDFIGKFEGLTDDMASISQMIWGELRPDMDLSGKKNSNSSPRATGAGKSVVDYYTDEMARLVRDRYAADFENFGYSLDLEDASAYGESVARRLDEGVGDSPAVGGSQVPAKVRGPEAVTN